MTGTGRRPSKPEELIAGAVGVAFWPGWFGGAYIGARIAIAAIGGHAPPDTPLVAAYAAMAVAGLLSCPIALRVTEVREATARVHVTGAEVLRGTALALCILSLAVGVLWQKTGFRGIYVALQFWAAPLGAWLAARHVSPFGSPRRPRMDEPAVVPE